MPELPEVETVRRTLEPGLVGQRITKVEPVTGKIIKQPAVCEFCSGLTGRQVAQVARRGKYLLVELEGNKCLVVHLRMTGQFTLVSPEQPREKHTHVVFTLSNGRELRYVDPRQFGEMHLLPRDNYASITGLRTIGPEPLGQLFQPEQLYRNLQGKKSKIKSVLLDQRVVAGLGNIYVDEALFRAGVNPERPAGTLTVEETEAVYSAVREVLAEGIEYRGTSIKDYVDGEGKSGSFQNRLKAYGRAGEPCFSCGSPMAKTKIGGRTTVFCPDCQK
ncbi:MAG TPA: bifunctional DNA-formamidopyrimidine glycosylase/DNA-(apurinic or apyrimidinic site) lyase [Bacillota bacterium]|nr:bifunctional DNA-formamidopyrimidine glycosylase/DNA-(apurinic or apyrimidinic site) lyase [Bacillota bacterium]